MKTLNEFCLLRAIETYVLNDDKMKVYHYLKSVKERLANKTATYLKIETEDKVEHIEIWPAFESLSVSEIVELIELEYEGNLNFAEEIFTLH